MQECIEICCEFAMTTGNADIHMFLREQLRTNQQEPAKTFSVPLEPWLYSYLGSLTGYFGCSQMQVLLILFSCIYDLV